LGGILSVLAILENFMAMMGSAAYALYPENVALLDVLRTLGQAGFDKESICMMLSPKHPITSIVRDTNAYGFEPDTNAVTAGLLGWLSEFGAVLIPTFGFFIRSREFFHALVVEQDSLAGQHGTLAGLGFADDDAKRYENHLRDVGVMLYVTCPETARTHWALELLRATGAQETGLLSHELAFEAAAAV
jgi:hypothetical protein